MYSAENGGFVSLGLCIWFINTVVKLVVFRSLLLK